MTGIWWESEGSRTGRGSCSARMWAPTEFSLTLIPWEASKNKWPHRVRHSHLRLQTNRGGGRHSFLDKGPPFWLVQIPWKSKQHTWQLGNEFSSLVKKAGQDTNSNDFCITDEPLNSRGQLLWLQWISKGRSWIHHPHTVFVHQVTFYLVNAIASITHISVAFGW